MTTYQWGAFAEPLSLWEINNYYIFWVCVCSLRYPACNAHALYCHLWPARLYYIILHYLINNTIFGKKGGVEYTSKMCVSTFSTTLVKKKSIPRETERDMITNVYLLTYLLLNYLFIYLLTYLLLNYLCIYWLLNYLFIYLLTTYLFIYLLLIYYLITYLFTYLLLNYLFIYLLTA